MFAPASFRGRSAVRLWNDVVEVIVLTGGGHIASLRLLADSSGNPLWTPPWSTREPALRKLASDEFDPVLESQLLSHIGGHNLCCDVFGAHSKGETERSGLAFHGEASQVVWEAEAAGKDSPAALVMRAELPATCMTVRREFHLQPGQCHVTVVETITSTVGFERVWGRAQHVTFGEEFLAGGAEFDCNADVGHTWPEDLGASQEWATDTDFAYPNVPAKSVAAAAAATAATTTAAASIDWRKFPRAEGGQGDLCTLRINPSSPVGCMTAYQPAWNLSVWYTWSRAAFPWLVTWEENKSRDSKPWSSRTLARGLEFSSYALPLGRRWNVEKGTLLDTPTFQWLDAHESVSTSFTVGLKAGRTTVDEAIALSS